MALFTFVLEFDGGTYISQSSARSAGRAVAQYASDLVRNEAISTLPIRRTLSQDLKAAHPVAIEGVRNVWCCSSSVSKKFALLNIVATVGQ